MYAPPNTPPVFTSSRPEIELEAGKIKVVNVGSVTDFEDDEFILSEWSIKSQSEKVNWVFLVSDTNSPEVEFNFGPPLSTAGSKFILELTFLDKHESDP